METTKMRKPGLLFIVLLISLGVSAQDILPDNPRGFVNDYANMLSSSEVNRLEQKLRNYRDKTSNVFAVATIESLQGNSIEEVATVTFSKWKLWEGQRGERDNGVLLLISEGDRKFRIEVGYGLEGAIPDVMANRILNDILSPNFQDGNIYGGIDRATDAMIQLAAGEFEGFPERQNSEDGSIPIDVIIFIIIIIIVVISRGRGGKHGGGKRTLSGSDVLLWGLLASGGHRRGGGGFGSSGGGGSFGGFGGGGGFGSGGGGASGGW